MMNLSKAEFEVFLRNDFFAFAQRCFYELNSSSEFLHSWHIEVVAETLEKCRAGLIRRLIINLPPRSLKSHMVSVAFPAWLLGHDATAQIICASYAQDLAGKFGSDCRSVMTSEWYRSVFSGTRLAGARQAVHDFSTTQRGCRLSTSVCGVLTGRGADYIVIDDPLKPDEALSETQRQTVNSWYDHTLISRLNNKREGRIILVAQRLHEDDLVGHVLRQGGWHLLKFPAIAEQDEQYIITTPYGRKTYTRRNGEALHPEREPLEVLASIREVQGEYHFAGQFQQSPSPLGGGMVQVGWFKTYTEAAVPATFDLVLQSWDTSNKATELSDYSVCSTWGVGGKDLYLLHIYRKRMNYPDLKRAVREQAAAFGAKVILIEDKASGTQLIQELISEGLHSIQKYEPTLDKIVRMYSVTSTVENGFVYLPAKAEWLAEYLHEMASFPKGRFDDQVDSTSQALDWFKNRLLSETFGLVEYYKKMAIVTDGGKGADETAEPRICANCGGPMSQRIPGGLRCIQCGSQWLDPRCQPDVHRFNRTDFWNGAIQSRLRKRGF